MSAAVKPPTAREVALQVVRDVFGPNPRGAREALDYRLRRTDLAPRDRAFATELAYGAIKMRRLLDHELQPYVGERAKTLPQPIAEILRLGTYQLRAMHGVEAYAAVSESVGLARKYGHKGTAGLVNAVLRRVATEPARDADLATRVSLPTWVVSHWRERFGAERLDPILAGVNAPAAFGLCVDLRNVSREGAQTALDVAGIATSPSAFAQDVLILDSAAPPGEVERLANHRWHVHAEAAAFPVDVLDPQPGARIVELCCGRGNKTLQIASRTRDKATVLAVDDDPRKVAQTRARMEEAGIASVALVVGDVATMRASADADYVLLDAPCSGLGILGRQPEARWRKQPDDPDRMAATQRKLLRAAAGSVKPGGVLVYAVCSTDRREGEDVVDAFLAEHPDFARAPLPARYAPFTVASGDLLVPPGIEGRDGFFVARMTRTP
ncbi:MAG: methyltransferase domain-containing protein [Candidatus Eremiobacteraeota bacterium]|nr:methyltransferase domain-containing protein [Candidatus Eremiobacteraeota bacterium]